MAGARDTDSKNIYLADGIGSEHAGVEHADVENIFVKIKALKILSTEDVVLTCYICTRTLKTLELKI